MRLVVPLSVSLFAASGCGLLLDADPGQGGFDSGGRDGAVDSRVMDVITPEDATNDAPTPDIGPDGSDGSPGCVSVSDPTTVVRYTFDSDPLNVLVDETGTRDGTSENVVYVPGVCGQALAFPPPGSHGHVPNHTAFETLYEGSIEFWVRLATYGGFGLVSRDWQGAEDPGHFTIYTSNDGHVVLRLQNMAPDDNAVWLCSNARVELGTWSHVGVSWGGTDIVRLWVDGELATNTDVLRVDAGGAGADVPCGANRAGLGIGGNTLSWIFGASAALRTDTSPNLLTGHFDDGAIDEVHIRNVRMDFGSP